MKRLLNILLLAGLMAAIGGFPGLIGCEDEPDTDDVPQHFDSDSWAPPPSEWAVYYPEIDPSEVTLGAGQNTVYFTVEGGIEPYAWSVGDISLGTIMGGGQDAVYVRNGATVGANVVICTDSVGTPAMAVVIQQ